MRLLGIFVTAAMALTLVYGFTQGGGFFDEGGDLLNLAWGKVTVIDLYLLLAVFGAWIVHREGWNKAIPWLVGLIVGGSLVAGVYLIFASRRSGSASADAAALP